MAKAYTDRPPGTKAVRVDLPEAEHAELRVLAARSGIPMSEYARDVVLEAVRGGKVFDRPAPKPEPGPKRPRGRPKKEK